MNRSYLHHLKWNYLERIVIGPLQLGGHVPSNAELESKLFCDDKSNDCLEHHAYVYLKGGYFEFKR